MAPSDNSFPHARNRAEAPWELDAPWILEPPSRLTFRSEAEGTPRRLLRALRRWVAALLERRIGG